MSTPLARVAAAHRTMIDLAPDIEQVSRFLCPYCRRKTYASKKSTRRHMTACHMNPASRACSSCVHFRRQPCCAYGSDECGCKGLNECAVGAFVTWRFNDHHTHEPDPEGWWTHVEDWRRDCPSYEPPPTYHVQTDGDIVWVHASTGHTVARFGRNGIDAGQGFE